MTIKMRLKMENRSHRSDKNGPRPWDMDTNTLNIKCDDGYMY